MANLTTTRPLRAFLLFGLIFFSHYQLSVCFRPRGPLTWLDPGAFGTLGVGGGFALGAKLVRPDSEVWIVYGDGSLGFSVAEFDTFTRHKVSQSNYDVISSVIDVSHEMV